MNIAIDCRMCAKSGIGSFIDGILPYLLQSNHRFLLLGLDKNARLPSLPKKIYEAQNADLLPCAIAPFSIKETFFFPSVLLNKINACDVFFSPYCNIPSGIKCPIYTTIHDVVFLDVPLASRIGTAMRKIFYKRAIQKSKAIFTVSQFSKKRIIAHLKCKKPIHVVYSSVPDFLKESISPLPQKTDTIIFIGNIKKHKGLHTLLPAFLGFRKKCKEVNLPIPKLLIVGQKDNFRTKDTSLSIPDVADGVEFTGYITNEELKVLLSSAKILVQPSLYEGFGLPPLEALSCGTRAIVSDIEVFKEVYKDLPVIFFNAGSEKDLQEKLFSEWNKYTPIPPTKSRYSFKNTTEAILTVLAEKPYSC